MDKEEIEKLKWRRLKMSKEEIEQLKDRLKWSFVTKHYLLKDMSFNDFVELIIEEELNNDTLKGIKDKNEIHNEVIKAKIEGYKLAEERQKQRDEMLRKDKE